MPAKNRLLVANWKMNLGLAASSDLAASFVTLATGCKNTDIWIASSAITLPAVYRPTAGSAVLVGAQNVHWEAKGAYTGETSAEVVREVGAHFSLIGHSERRRVFGEGNDECAKRASCALKYGLWVIFCVGETLTERESGITIQIIDQQIEPLLSEVVGLHAERVIIAYEPVWAIGTGRVAGMKDIAETHAHIRRRLSGGAFAKAQLLYGGSVAPDNFEEILSVPNVDGGLVGGASLTTEKFAKLVAISERTRRIEPNS